MQGEPVEAIHWSGEARSITDTHLATCPPPSCLHPEGFLPGLIVSVPDIMGTENVFSSRTLPCGKYLGQSPIHPKWSRDKWLDRAWNGMTRVDVLFVVRRSTNCAVYK